MSRYIDSEALKKHYAWCDNAEQELFDSIVDGIPTADVQEVKHGKWVRKIYCETYNGKREREIYVCPFCANTVFINENYCPNCGARMDGDAV